jgi:hypothetical protein
MLCHGGVVSSATVDAETARATYVVVSKDTVTVSLADNRAVSMPISWYPRLVQGSPAGRNNWKLLGHGTGVHWPDLDEDLSVEGMLAERASMEGKASLAKWVAGRRKKHGKLPAKHEEK